MGRAPRGSRPAVFEEPFKREGEERGGGREDGRPSLKQTVVALGLLSADAQSENCNGWLTGLLCFRAVFANRAWLNKMKLRGSHHICRQAL